MTLRYILRYIKAYYGKKETLNISANDMSNIKNASTLRVICAARRDELSMFSTIFSRSKKKYFRLFRVHKLLLDGKVKVFTEIDLPTQSFVSINYQ